MGDPRKPRRNYATPRHPWRRDQIDQELQLLGEFGLRNKRELWRSQTLLSKIRGIARVLLAQSGEDRPRREKTFLSKVSRMGLLPPNATLAEILDLNVRNLLARRLQTQLYQQGLAATIQQSRQFIVHGHISIGDKRVYVPGYLVSKNEETQIRFDPASTLSKPDHPSRIQVSKKPPTEAPLRPVAPLTREAPQILEQETPVELPEEEEPVEEVTEEPPENPPV